ncbi:MAG TPA: ABC transporter permease subunit [Ignavibacteriaceae bacterium]|nr:ABC transporter permease subunit [Ignavibacteriaceae bacterium]
MNIRKSHLRKIYYFLFTYLILWILLFEFLLPVNQVLPKPSIVFQSFPDLWNDYNLPENYLSTISVIYISLVLAFFSVKILSPYLVEKDNFISLFINSLEWFSEFLPGIIIGLVLIFWFPESEFVEFIFAFATAFTSLMIKFQNESEKVNEEYILSAQSLGVSENKISRLIIWKNIQPKLMGHLFNLHFYLWSMLIIFEFIKGGFGLGVIFNQALEYKDLSAIFSVFLITGITIYFGTLILKYIRNKFVFWS